MKKILSSSLAVLGLVLISQSASASFTLYYQNKDSQRLSASAQCPGGNHSSVSLGGGTTGSVTVAGSGPCQLSLKNTVTIKDRSKIIVQDGKISVQ